MIILILENSLCFGQKRIIYGEEVQSDELEDWNFLVALFEKHQADDYYDSDYYQFSCGGAILNSWQILTAAHCIFNTSISALAVVPGLNYPKILIGEPDTWDPKGYEVQHVIHHEDYDDLTVVNDIAIFTLAEPLNVSQSSYIDVEPFNYHPESNLHFKSLNDNCIENSYSGGELCSVAGWGFQDHFDDIEERHLSKIDLPIINYKKCKERYGNFLDSEDVILTDSHICAGSKTWLLQLQEVCKV